MSRPYSYGRAIRNKTILFVLQQPSLSPSRCCTRHQNASFLPRRCTRLRQSPLRTSALRQHGGRILAFALGASTAAALREDRHRCTRGGPRCGLRPPPPTAARGFLSARCACRPPLPLACCRRRRAGPGGWHEKLEELAFFPGP
ncbi:hypothetical protein SETIT_4G136500v2 [Setaria italica]|uniref:Uncharacterized protein n=1 Tax=Setaria italica TaxID=4555 RepID=K3XZU3_SETIT|nr:hypothetical protein SETIT_4G136500v2 [Setaria italica]